MPLSAAFFDFDKTLLDAESSRIMIHYMRARRDVFFARKPIPAGYLIHLALAYELYKRNLYPDEAMTVLLLKFFKGRSPEPFFDMADDFYHACLKPHLAPAIMARFQAHKERGDMTVLISAGVRYALEPVQRDLGFDHLLCTELETGPEGLFTGRARGPICIDVHKRDKAVELAQRHDIDLSASSAYGNHHSDIPLLASVGFPTAVEPTGPLRRTAVKNGWPILLFALGSEA